MKYCQLRQNYVNNYFEAKVGKELPKLFPESSSVGKLDVGNFAFLKNCKHSASQQLPKILSRKVEVGNLLPD